VGKVEQLLAVAGEAKAIDALYQCVSAEFLKVPGPQQTVTAAAALLVVVIFLAAFDGQNRKDSLTRRACDASIAPFGDGEGQHPVGDAIQIDTDGFVLLFLLVLLFRLATSFGDR